MLTVDVEDPHQGAVMEALGRAPRRLATWSPTARAACASITASRRAA